ncbi:transglutaminase family protein [Mangrovimicrobium sediminis]|uniref:Transglutaminase family protein n=1 Tax=Mangrovimicrobium sediminis TaxID=2562682 RepID=A0A4Z0M7Z3_9GAMM|nr:transglutaminase family protein [Haliea sp. SAOS-164]TGD75641.1 transglutaminase family protein [Haliea sp. SAOS-164]
MKYRIRHRTRYEYQGLVSQCYSVTHLLPRNTFYQRCERASISVDPLPAQGADRTDYFGNHAYHFTVQFPHRYLEVVAESEVEIFAQRQSLALDFGATCAEVRSLLYNLEPEENIRAREFLLDSPKVVRSQTLADYASDCFVDDRPFFSCVRELTHKIYSEFTFDPRSTEVTTPLEEVLELRAGVCQDFAHLAIGCLRSLGYPARYVSGYLETLPPPGQTKLEGADASHAWFSVYSPTEGWADFDPTNNLMAMEQHITTAWGRDYSDITPLKGSVLGGGAGHALDVAVDVQRLGA